LSAFDAGHSEIAPGLVFKFFWGFNNFEGHLSVFTVFILRSFFSRFFAGGLSLAQARAVVQ
jgi:hypothetical protein